MLILSAFFSGSEMAFISINRAIIADKARKGDKHAKILEKLLRKPDEVVSSIVIGNNIVNIFASILAGYVATSLIGNIGIGIATVMMFFLVIVFSESTPKAFGRKNEHWALRSAKALRYCSLILHPFVVLLNHISKFFLSILGGKKSKSDMITEDEIMAMMRLGEEEGTIEKDEREMVSEVFEFDETIADDVDQPRHTVVFINQNDTIDDLIEKSIQTGYSRFPVFRKNYDDVVGMVHVKDSLTEKDHTKKVKTIMRKVLKIRPGMKVDDVFRKMKNQRTHLALLQNKKGKTIGLLSMEDLVEEIFGDIRDEHD
jgi:putative hemolysin